MSGVLHPVGPEPVGTYWARRFLVLAVAVLLVVGAVLAATAGQGRATVTANPPPAVPVAPTPTPEITAVATPSSPLSPTPSRLAPRATTVPRASVPGAARTSPPVPRRVRPTAAPRATKPLVPKSLPTRPAPVPGCDPSDLRATLTGRRVLRVEQPTTFTLSLINGSKAPCRVRVSEDNFELKIYSGTDRIWSTKDCSRAVDPISRVVGSEQAVAWRLRWDGQRSRKNCEDRPEAPRAGTYAATAQLAGAKPVQLWLVLRG